MIRHRSTTSKPAIRRGAAAVEFAVVAPLFLLLMAGIIEFGQAFRIEHTLSNAARRGARSAVVDGSTSSQVSQLVAGQCAQTLSVAEADITVGIKINGMSGTELSEAIEGDEIRVTVSVPFSKAGAGFYAKMFSTATIDSVCTLEHE